VYGPGDGGHFPTLARLAGQHGHWRWTHGYVEDVAHAIVTAALHPHPPGKVYNVGEAETRTVTQRLDGWNVRPAEEGPASHLVKDFDFAQDIVYDTSRIRRELGYRELVTYEEGMRRTLGAAGPQAA
jgi:nucleoside-diphosphate-sugar epimerase